MVRIEETVLIEAPPEAVWSAFTDLTCWAGWNSVLTEARGAGEEACLVPGTGFSCCLRPYKVPVRFRGHVEVAEAPRNLLWTVNRLGVRSRHWFRFAAREGGTLCMSEEELTGPAVTLAGPLFPLWKFRALTRRFLEDLKGEAERRAAAP